MIISTRGRYALRVIIDLAERPRDSYTPMRDVAKRQHISLKYLEKILPDLTRAGIIEGVHGRGGGYRLCRAPADCTVGEILRLTEGDMAPVACCHENDAGPCRMTAECRTMGMWRDFYDMINKYFDGITVADLTAAEPHETKTEGGLT